MILAATPMRTRPAPALVRHRTLVLRTTGRLEFIDLTADVRDFVSASGLEEGMVNIQSRHTTAGIIVNEHEPLLLGDLRRMLERLAPVEGPYDHDDLTRRTVNLEPNERANGHAHCQSLLIRASETLAVTGAELALGKWQRVFLLELDGPRERRVTLTIMGV